MATRNIKAYHLHNYDKFLLDEVVHVVLKVDVNLNSLTTFITTDNGKLVLSEQDNLQIVEG